MANAFTDYSPISAAFRDLGINGAPGSDFLAQKIGAQQFDPYFLMSKYGADLSAVQDPYTIMNNAATAISGARPTSSLGGYLGSTKPVSPVASLGYSPDVTPAAPVSYASSGGQSYSPPSAVSVSSVAPVASAGSG